MRQKRAVVAQGLTAVALGLALCTGAGVAARAAERRDDTAKPGPRGTALIARVWHGKTPREKADEYEKYLGAAVRKFPSIRGNLGYQLMRLDGGPEGDAYTEFQVVSYWESLDAIRAYAGDDVTRTHDLPRDHEFLVGMEPRVRNYAIRDSTVRP